MSKSRIILAVDTPDLETACKWVECASPYITAYKLGLEFFATFGAEGVAKLKEVSDADLFLDLKLHDIPNTVAGATAAIVHLAPRFLTVHASGGSAMIAAAVHKAPKVSITAVTILTSLSDKDLREIGFSQPPLASAVGLAIMAQSAGARAIVCSPHEIAAIRLSLGSEISIIAPGVRPAGEMGKDDQSRTMTPRQAIDAGASYLVIGRPITKHWLSGSDQMKTAIEKIAMEMG